MKGFGTARIQNWGFVTGLPRSGTTFVAKVLSRPLAVDYLHEPFNPSCGIPSLRHCYLYLRPDLSTPEAPLYHAETAALLRYDVTFKTGLYTRDAPLQRFAKRLVGSRGGVYLRLARWNPFHRAAVIKDPTALFLTAFLAHHFPVTPVLVLRHPVSLAASWQRLGWVPPLRRLYEQAPLMEDYLAEDRPLLTQDWADPIERIAVFWRAAYKVLLAQAARHPGWQVVTHEALSSDPVPIFQALYGALGLPWSAGVARYIERLAQAGNPAEARADRVQDFRRHSAALFTLRRDALTVAQRQAVYDLVADVAAPYYPRESFALDAGVATP